MAGGEEDIRRERNQFCRIGADAIGISPCPTGLDLYVAPDGPVRLLQALQKCPMARLPQCIVGSTVMEHADAPHPLALLRARPKRPRRRRAAEQRHELPPSDAGHGRSLPPGLPLAQPATEGGRRSMGRVLNVLKFNGVWSERFLTVRQEVSPALPVLWLPHVHL